MTSVLTKTCSKCGGDPQSLEEFYVDKRTDKHVGECRTCVKARTATYARSRGSEYRHGRNTQTRYGISVERYNELLEAQGHACAICSQPDQYGYRLAVDHDHQCCPGRMSCGECVRGLLCRCCNTALGLLGEDSERMVAAAAYLIKTASPTKEG